MRNETTAKCAAKAVNATPTVMVKVFHVKDVDGLSGRSLLGEIAWGEAAIGFEFNHELVAEVTVEVRYDYQPEYALEKAFRFTNNIDSSWVADAAGNNVVAINPKVSPLGTHGRRSTSVGDVATILGDAYVCAPMGWVKITSAGQRIVRGAL